MEVRPGGAIPYDLPNGGAKVTLPGNAAWMSRCPQGAPGRTRPGDPFTGNRGGVA
jgi:hypothetical protein